MTTRRSFRWVGTAVTLATGVHSGRCIGAIVRADEPARVKMRPAFRSRCLIPEEFTLAGPAARQTLVFEKFVGASTRADHRRRYVYL